MSGLTRAMFALWLCALSMAGIARADTTVRVVDTWPKGDEITLGSNQNFYLRVAYATDKPAGIWVEPYFQGHPALAGSNPSGMHTGSGEDMLWFFVSQPGGQVDEVRIKAGDGSLDRTPVVADYRVHVTGGTQPHDTHDDPDWVVTMQAQAAATQRREYEARMHAPVQASDAVLVQGFMLGVFAIGVFSIGMPLWGLRKWRGGWRVAAAFPAVLMAFVVLRIVFDTSRDPTSHNLWPFEVLIWGAVSVVVMAALVIVRKLAGVGRVST